MKYIRTKDGKIYDTLDERGLAISQTKKQCDFVDFVVVQNRLGDFAIPKTEIVKQADTIEELCDEFIVYQPWTNGYYLTKAQECIKANIQANYYKSFGYENPTIYGAIWTNKGLIYVAKMNEKGELELL